jgi:hypothetical protein
MQWCVRRKECRGGLYYDIEAFTPPLPTLIHPTIILLSCRSFTFFLAITAAKISVNLAPTSYQLTLMTSSQDIDDVIWHPMHTISTNIDDVITRH